MDPTFPMNYVLASSMFLVREIKQNLWCELSEVFFPTLYEDFPKVSFHHPSNSYQMGLHFLPSFGARCAKIFVLNFIQNFSTVSRFV